MQRNPLHRVLRNPKQWRRHAARSIKGAGTRRSIRSMRLEHEMYSNPEATVATGKLLAKEPIFRMEQADRDRTHLTAIIARTLAHSQLITRRSNWMPQELERDLRELFKHDPFQGGGTHYIEQRKVMEEKYGTLRVARLIRLAGQLVNETHRAIVWRARAKVGKKH